MKNIKSIYIFGDKPFLGRHVSTSIVNVARFVFLTRILNKQGGKTSIKLTNEILEVSYENLVDDMKHYWK